MKRAAPLCLVAFGLSIATSGVAAVQTTAPSQPTTPPTTTSPAAPPADPTPPATNAPAPPPVQKAPPASNQNQPAAPAQTQQTVPPTQSEASGTRGGNAATTSAGSLNTEGLTADQLHERIDAALRAEPTLSGSNLVVNVGEDAIDVSGMVGSAKERVTARRIVQSFAGNRRVRERITVTSGSASSNPTSTPNGKPNGKPNGSTTTSTETKKSDAEKQNRPVADPAKEGDKSEEPR